MACYPLPLTSPQRQAHPQQLLYAELGPRPEGLPHKLPSDDPPSQYAAILPHAIPPEKGIGIHYIVYTNFAT